MTETPDTSRKALRAIRERGEDASLRKRVAAEIAARPMTTNQLVERFPQHGANAIRPRVNELLRMGCLKREGKRMNPSGHQAYVHRITARGVRYLNGEIDPEPGPPLAKLKADVVEVARAVVSGDVDLDVLQIAVERHDDAKHRLDPEWSR